MSEPFSWQEAEPVPPALRRVRDRASSAEAPHEGLQTLAGGLAHDLNNILTAILGSACLGLQDQPAGSDGRARLDAIREAVGRATAITDELLAYAGSPLLDPQPLDLSRLLASSEVLLAGCRLDLAQGLPAADGSPSLLRTALAKLVENARESMDGPDGRITVRTGLQQAALPVPRVFFEVADSGRGMSAPVRRRCVEPFFTTKAAGRGLGLAAVAGIVEAHRGLLEFESAPSEGSRFRVVLPAVSAIARG